MEEKIKKILKLRKRDKKRMQAFDSYLSGFNLLLITLKT